MGYAKTCSSCGNEFDTNNIRQKKCRKDCGRISQHSARAEKRLHNDITFVGVDGEGVDRPDGKHEYVMLSVGSKTLWNKGKALSLESILQFLYECYTEQPEAAFVGFFLGYDFIQWEKLLPEDRAYLLLTNNGISKRKSLRLSRANPYPDAVVWEGWEIDIMAGRRFKLRPHTHHRSEWTGLCRNRTCNYQFDTGVFAPDEIGELVEGEMDFVIPDEDTSSEFTGTAGSFWKSFRRSHTVGSGRHKAKAAGWMYICDTGPFWQTSFLNVINPKAWENNPVCTDEEYRTVVLGKADRGHTYDYNDDSYYDEMAKYNTLENDILSRVTQRLNQGFMNDRIPIKIPKTDWYGPGRAAQLWMDQLHSLCADDEAREYNKYVTRNNSSSENPRLERKNETGLLNLDVYLSMPTWFYQASKDSYYGGWFEQFIHGHVGDVWEYDINSAYPYIIANLPCLHTSGIHNGSYSRGEGTDSFVHDDEHRYTLVFCTVRGSNPYIGAMPYRTKQGLISRPQNTKGWYWWHEIQAAQRARLIDNVTIERWVSYKACECTPPFNPSNIGIEALYQLRLDFGKNTPQGKSAKLVYNSAYGKTAQSIGQPKYSNPVYASLITAGCRTLILEAIATHPEGAQAVSMVATDGVYFLSRHPSLDIDPGRLGAWDETGKKNITQLMPGVYWDDKSREAVKNGKAPSLKSRGVSARDLASEIERLDYLFASAHNELASGRDYEWPSITFTTGFLLDSAKAALQRGKWETAGRVTHGSSRNISSDPYTKREPTPYIDEEFGVVRSRPYREHGILESTPYEKSFGYQEINPLDGLFGDSVSMDGDPMQYWKDIINGN